MDTPQAPFRMIGLTGGIACGKSTVARQLRDAGLRVLDADLIAREVVEPGTEGLQAVVDAFGPRVLDAQGHLDRARLGQLVFSDPEQRKRLNAILHPRIGMQTARYVQQARQEGLRAVVYEAALLVENGLHHGFDLLIVVTARPEVQRQRLLERDQLDPQEAQGRLDAQMPLAQKEAAADIVLDNSGSPDKLTQAVQEMLHGLPQRLWPQLPPQEARQALFHTAQEAP